MPLLLILKISLLVHLDKEPVHHQGWWYFAYTLNKRILVSCQIGDFQKVYLKKGMMKEVELIRKRNTWYFPSCSDLPDPSKKASNGKVLGVDMGENNLSYHQQWNNSWWW